MKKSLLVAVIVFAVAGFYWLNHAQAQVADQRQMKWQYAQLQLVTDINSFSFITPTGQKDAKSMEELYTAMTNKELKVTPTTSLGLELMNAAGADGWEYINTTTFGQTGTIDLFKRPAQ
jgi:hypothetical protein